MSFTAGITFADDRVSTVDVTGIDGTGLAYTAEEGPVVVPWSEVKAVMLATTDHMLESAGSLFSMAEAIQETAGTGAPDAAELRRFGIRLLQQAAPRVCPLGAACGLGPPSAGPGPDGPEKIIAGGPDGSDVPDIPDSGNLPDGSDLAGGSDFPDSGDAPHFPSGSGFPAGPDIEERPR